MCFKAGSDELDTVKNLMTMGVSVVVADALDVDMDEVEPSSRLVEDLRMTPKKAKALKAGIAEYFDGIEVDLAKARTLQDLLDLVVMAEFRNTGGACAVEAPMEFAKAA